MYPEFVPIYIALVIIIILLVVILCLIIKNSAGSTQRPTNFATNNFAQGSVGQVVFCKNCATQYDASSHACPRCGTPR